MTAETLNARTRKTLETQARRLGIERWHSMTKAELVRALLRAARRKKPAAVAASRNNGKAKAASRSAPRPGERKRSARKQANGQATTARSRDLCTVEVADRTAPGRHNYLDILVCDPHWIKAVWDLTRESIRRAELKLAADWHQAVPVLRVFAVSMDDEHNTGDTFVKDVHIEAGVDKWYVHVPAEHRNYRLHIGYRTQKGDFFAVAKSNVCHLPLLNTGSAAANGKATGNGHSRGHEKNGLSGRNGSPPDEEVGLGRPLGFSSLSHFGPAATEDRVKGNFCFKLDTELIVHGTTRPGAALTIQGDHVELRDDGSFTIRLPQPEGRQVIAFTAVSPSGGERRMIVLGMERNTKELERQYFDGGHPDGYTE